MARREEIIAFCDETLAIADFSDYGPNGLQVPGDEEVTRIATAVSAHLETLNGAVSAGAQLLLTHHGLFWDFHDRALSPAMTARLRVALEGGLSVAGYHLPLDAHREIGNNALLCEALGFAPSREAFAVVKGRPIGVVGRRDTGVDAGDLFAMVAGLSEREPLVFDAGPSTIHNIGIVSGAGASEIHDAVGLGLDAFLTGEPAEHVMADAREGRIHFIAAGHYATETRGIRRLGEVVAERFEVEHEFIDAPNPV